jgi:hypothetical protein
MIWLNIIIRKPGVTSFALSCILLLSWAASPKLLIFRKVLIIYKLTVLLHSTRACTLSPHWHADTTVVAKYPHAVDLIGNHTTTGVCCWIGTASLLLLILVLKHRQSNVWQDIFSTIACLHFRICLSEECIASWINWLCSAVYRACIPGKYLFFVLAGYTDD